MSQKHKVFISYHHENDQNYRDLFEKLFSVYYDIMVSKSVQIGDIDPDLKAETIRQKIRDEYLSDSTVTVVLIGTETWKRKHVDWEISSSIRQTKHSSRSGLLGIFLPNHPDYRKNEYFPVKIPPRLYHNVQCGFAKLCEWSEDPGYVQRYIHSAFENREKIDPDNSLPLFSKNRSGEGWKS